MEIIALSGIAIMTTVISVMIKKNNPEISILLSLCAGVLILLMITSKVTPIIDKIKDLISATGMPIEYTAILLKTLGICFLTQFSADSCRDAGESAMASKIELAGKVFIVVISLPLFEQVAKTAMNLIS